MARLSNAIKKTDIPSWFVLSKYAFASELDSAGWYEQILAREQLFLMMGHRKSTGGPPSEKDLASRLASQIWLEAKVSFKDPGILSSICGHDGAVGRINSSYAKSVHSITYRQFLQQDERIKSEAKEKAKRWWKNISAPDFGSEKIDMDLAYQVMEFVDLPLHASQNRTSLHAIADVDLSMPDAILLDSFKAWLATVREDFYLDSPKQYRKPDFASWVRLGVLPFLDLTSWAELKGKSIPNRLMASLLFPAGDGGEETIRKTTAPIAMEMIERGGYSDRTILDTLLAVAAHEGRELGGG